jgi:hypothetical protein
VRRGRLEASTVFDPILESSGLSLHSQGPLDGEVNDARAGSCRDCFGMSLLGGDVVSRGVVRWMV